MQMYGTVVFIVLCLLFLNFMPLKSCLFKIKPFSARFSDSYSETCTNFLPKDYKLYESPKKGIPIKVYSYLSILDIGEINEERMDYLLDMFVTFFWQDERLKKNNSVTNDMIPILLPKQCLQYLWQPDIFYERAKTVELFKKSVPAIIIRIFSDGKIMITKRFLFRSSCDMKFHDYPFDSQECEFFISLISPDLEAILHWSDENNSLFKNQSAVIDSKKIEPLQYYIARKSIRKSVYILPDANYTSLVIDFIFRRRLVGNIINTFIPSTLIVLMSWVGFWIHADAVPARVALSVTSLLTLCTQIQHYQSQLPPVNYIKAMDIWLFVCILFVYSTLLEFAVAYTAYEPKERKRKRTPKQDVRENEDISPSKSHMDSPKRNITTTKICDSYSLKMLGSRKEWNISYLQLRYMQCKWTFKTIDEISQIFYPFCFIIFIIVYWIHYLNRYYD